MHLGTPHRLLASILPERVTEMTRASRMIRVVDEESEMLEERRATIYFESRRIKLLGSLSLINEF